MGNIVSCFRPDFGAPETSRGVAANDQRVWSSSLPWARRPAGFVDYTEPFQRINGRLRTGSTLAVAPDTSTQSELRDAFDTLGLNIEGRPLTPQRLASIFVLGDSTAELHALAALTRHALISLTRPLRMSALAGEMANSPVVRSLHSNPSLLTFMAASGTEPAGPQGADLAERFGVLKALGLDLDAPNRQGLTPMHVAAQSGNSMAIHALAACGARLDPMNRQGLSPLMVAAHLNQANAVTALIACGADTELASTAHSARAAHWAALENAADAIHALGAAGANLNARASKGATPLHMAAGRGREEAIRALAQLECDLEARTEPEGFELTAIGFSALHGQPGSIRTLATLGAQVDAPGAMGRTPIHFAVLKNNRATIDALHQAGCNLDAQDNQGDTALHIAAHKDALQAAAALIDAGANLNLRNRNGSRPVDIAGNASHPLMFHGLIDAGAEGPYHYEPGHPSGGFA